MSSGLHWAWQESKSSTIRIDGDGTGVNLIKGMNLENHTLVIYSNDAMKLRSWNENVKCNTVLATTFKESVDANIIHDVLFTPERPANKNIVVTEDKGLKHILLEICKIRGKECDILTRDEFQAKFAGAPINKRIQEIQNETSMLELITKLMETCANQQKELDALKKNS